MLYLKDILDTDKLEDLILNKRINVQVHPDLPLRVYNYSNMAQFANEWSHEERVCRGLIVGPDDEIVARGPSKFFNYGQPGAPEVAMDSHVNVTTKEDGSLGIGWHYAGHYGVATRGSFASDQAIHATKILSTDDKASILWGQERGTTRIWEIVYPSNRIVLDYGDRDELIVLGTVSNESGIIAYRPAGSTNVMEFSKAIALPIPDDQEGYVLDILGSDGPTGHLKLKGDRYKELHGAIFGLSERRIWEAIGEGRDMDMFVADLPDELQPWAQGVVDKLVREADELFRDVELSFVFMNIYFGVGLGLVNDIKEIPRRYAAQYILSTYPDIKGPLFSMLDGNAKAVKEWAHKQVRPEHRLFRVESQDSN